ncbi:MAG: hypothetical protein RLZZ265_3256, partial [Verrucomicrobiota bacterium]
MPALDKVLSGLGLLVVAAPVLLLAVFFGAFLCNRRLQEHTIG